MTKSTNTQVTLYRARLFLEEGQNEDALSTLKEIQAENEQEQRNVAYLLGWCYVQLKQWKEAIDVLSPLLESVGELGEQEAQSDAIGVLSPSLENVGGLEDQETQIERERQALFLLRLGVASANLGHYEDASRHFTLCLKILQERRVHLPVVRIKARYSLATVCVGRGLYPSAIQHYEEALRLCRHYGKADELPHIYHGLCYACLHTGDLTRAEMNGMEALSLYQQRHDRQMEARMYSLLGSVRYAQGNYRAASDHYTEALAIVNSRENPTMVMLICAHLAEAR